MILYDYFRSTACYRVRLALEIKGIAYEKNPIHLLTMAVNKKAPPIIKLIRKN